MKNYNNNDTKLYKEIEKHDSAYLHVTGLATYTDDIIEPTGCLHAYILKSPYAHAEITNIDLSDCYIDGVEAILTHKDIPAVNDVAPVFSGDPIFAENKVEYAGQSILAIIAKDIKTAIHAAKLAKISYKELPAILSIEDALEKQSFISDTFSMESGNVEKSFKNSPHIINGNFKIGGQEHFYLEGQVSLAIPDEANEITCWSSTQHPSEVQHLIAKMLGVSDNNITVKIRRMGGAFGGKESQASLIACIASLAAYKTKKAVKLRLDRDDDIILTGKRHPFAVSYKIGFNDEGLINGLDITHAIDCGMSADLSNAIADRAIFHTDNAYFLPNVKITSYRCKTNKASNTAFRGFGGPQGMFAIEYIIDEIARYLNKDPLEIRKINLYDHKDRLKNRCKTHYGMKVEDNIIADILNYLEEKSDYKNRKEQIKNFNKSNKILKKGLAITPVKFGISFTLTLLNQAGALVHIYKDGSIQLNHGGTEMGQGLHAKIIQIAATELSIDPNFIKITATNTSKVPNTSATAASSGTDMNGKAIQNAVLKIKNRLIAFAAKHFKISEDKIIFKNNKIIIGTDKISFKELIALAYENRISLSANGFYKTPKISWDKEKATGRPFLYFAYGAAVTEVIIDTLTGEYNILRTDIVHDVGNSINPAIDIGQIEGAYIQGNGWLTSEELYWNENGILKTHAPSTYKIPTSRDIPNIFNVELYPNKNTEDTIYKSKAVGEPPLMLAISTFMAIKDAVIAAGGNGNINAPATPEEILKSIER